MKLQTEIRKKSCWRSVCENAYLQSIVFKWTFISEVSLIIIIDNFCIALFSKSFSKLSENCFYTCMIITLTLTSWGGRGGGHCTVFDWTSRTSYTVHKVGKQLNATHRFHRLTWPQARRNTGMCCQGNACCRILQGDGANPWRVWSHRNTGSNSDTKQQISFQDIPDFPQDTHASTRCGQKFPRQSKRIC